MLDSKCRVQIGEQLKQKLSYNKRQWIQMSDDKILIAHTDGLTRDAHFFFFPWAWDFVLRGGMNMSFSVDNTLVSITLQHVSK